VGVDHPLPLVAARGLDVGDGEALDVGKREHGAEDIPAARADADHAQAEILPSPLLEKLLAEHPSLEDYLKEGNFAAFLAAATLELNKKARAS
jgi:hypothetical protein